MSRRCLDCKSPILAPHLSLWCSPCLVVHERERDLTAKAREIAAGLNADEIEGFRRCVISDQFHELRREKDKTSALYRWAMSPPCSTAVSHAALDRLKRLGVIEWNNGHRCTDDLGRALACVLAQGTVK